MTTTWPPELRHLTAGHHDRDWTTKAACRTGYDPELWFPEFQRDRRIRRAYNRSQAEATRIAMAVCSQCPVLKQCLEYALTTDTRYGIYGATTASERAKLTGRRIER